MFHKTDDSKQNLLILLLVILYFTVAYTVMNYYGISCVFLTFFKIPCPGCGMTRAVLSLLKGDIMGAASYNITVFFLPYVAVYLLFPLKHKIHRLLLLCIAGIAIINWVIKMIML